MLLFLNVCKLTNLTVGAWLPSTGALPAFTDGTFELFLSVLIRTHTAFPGVRMVENTEMMRIR